MYHIWDYLGMSQNWIAQYRRLKRKETINNSVELWAAGSDWIGAGSTAMFGTLRCHQTWLAEKCTTLW